MKIEVAYNQHDNQCQGKLKLLPINCGRCIHIELYCEVCEQRYVADVYSMEPV